MKPSYYILAAAAILASGACNAEKGTHSAAGSAAAAKAEAPIKPPANGDWTQIVVATGAGGYRMGKPDAKVKLLEFGSMTCPHCAYFEDHAYDTLVNDLVKSGNVSYEFRNYVRDPFDISASLIARCNGAKSFFPLTRQLYKDQPDWIAKVQQAPQAQVEAIQNLGPEKQFLKIAELAGLQKWAAMRGIPTAKSSQCLTNQDSVNQLVQMNSDATDQFPDFQGTPTFVMNGKMVDLGRVTQDQVWSALEAKLRQAISG